MPAPRWTRPALVAGLVWLAAVLVFWLQPQPDATVPDAAPPGSSAALPALASQAAATAAAAGGTTLMVALDADQALPADALSVRLAVLRIDPEDLAEFQTARSLDNVGATAASAAELANPALWLSPPIAAVGGGRFRIGPVQLPPAHSYALAIWTPDRHLAVQRFTLPTPDTTSHELPAQYLQPPTGVRLRLATAEPVRVQLQRLAAVDPADPLHHHVLRQMAPEVAAVWLDGAPMAVTDGTVLRPLLPAGSLRVTPASAAGSTGTPVDTVLQPGQITDLHLDLGDLDLQTVTLAGTLVADGTGAPLPGVRLTAPDGSTATSDAQGRFSLANLPRHQPSILRLAVDLDAIETVTPVPALSQWTLLPESLQPLDDNTVAATLAVPVQHWLVLHTAAGPTAPARGYPIHQLQEQGPAGWRDVAADLYLPTANGVAVSVRWPGTYRVLQALSPVQVHPSTEASLGPEQPVAEVHTLAAGNGTPVTVLVTGADGRPVARAQVAVLGPNTSLLPQTLYTDRSGQVRLPAANVTPLHLQVRTDRAEAEVRLDRLEPLVTVVLPDSNALP